MKSLAVAAALGLALVALGNVFPDEGWYLYAGRRVADGAMPYRDFAHFQAPLSPYVFALADGDRTTGRLICLACGLGAIALALDVARGRSTRAHTAAALMLVPASYTLRWYAVCRNIAPAALLLALGVWLAERRGRPAAAAVALALAGGVRLSAAGAVPALAAALALAGRRKDAARALLAGAVSLAAIFAPFALAAPRAFVFDNLLYHVGLHREGTWLEEVQGKALGVVKLGEHHQALVLGLLLTLWRRKEKEAGGTGQGAGGKWEGGRMEVAGAVALAVTLLHLVPGRLHTEYHELVVPLLAVVAGSACAPLVERFAALSVPARAGVALLLTAQVFGAYGQLYPQTGWSPAMVADVSAALARTAPDGEPVVTFVPDFALEADLPLADGLEMASVSLAIPSTTEDDCARLHVVTLATLARDLARRVPGAVVWRSLDDADPRRTSLYEPRDVQALDAALRANYTPVVTVHGWTIWRRSPA